MGTISWILRLVSSPPNIIDILNPSHYPTQSSPFGLPACRLCAAETSILPHGCIHLSPLSPHPSISLCCWAKGGGGGHLLLLLRPAIHEAETHVWSSSKQRGAGEEEGLIPTSLFHSPLFRRSASIHPDQGRLVTNRLRNE